jgi:SAM-dependent methyltransferase
LDDKLLTAPEDESEVKLQVREFYDSVGWKQVGAGLYQNARYEDLRPVAREYIDRCHLRVNRYLNESGRYLLDAGSGPIQYPKYLEYSAGYQYRVCLDISILALAEARERIGAHGLFVVGDAANLPFKSEIFDSLVSLHTVHHLPAGEQQQAFQEFDRVLAPGGKGVIVYSWGDHALLVRMTRPFILLAFYLQRKYRDFRRRRGVSPQQGGAPQGESNVRSAAATGTFTYKHDYQWVHQELGNLPGLQIIVWRSASTSFTRAFIHRRLYGRWWLRVLYWLEERAPALFGRIGQYPMLLISKPDDLMKANLR